jgi:DNA polymerase III gamma/tau subunit
MIPLLENVERLKEICDAENIKWTKEWLEIIAKLSEWSMRDSIKYLDQVSIVDEVNPVNCSRLLGVAWNQQIENFMDSIITQKFSDAYSILDSVEENWVSIETFVKQMITFLDENFSKYQADFLMLTNLIKRFLENSKFFTRHKVLLKAEIWWIFNVDTQKSTSQNLKEVVVREDKPKNEKKVSSTTYSDNKPIVQPQDNSISDTPESKEDKTQSQNIEPKEKLENSWNYDLEDIKKKMISKMVSKSLVSQLESSTHISSIAWSTIKIQVIWKMLFDHLKNHETNSKIVSAFNDILWGDYQIELEQISKEDFLAQHSGGLF